MPEINIAGAINNLIRKIEDEVKSEEEFYSDNDAKDWGCELGILISVNEAKLLLNAIKSKQCECGECYLQAAREEEIEYENSRDAANNRNQKGLKT